MSAVSDLVMLKLCSIFIDNADNHSAAIELIKYIGLHRYFFDEHSGKPKEKEIAMLSKELNIFISGNFFQKDLLKYKKAFVVLCAMYSYYLNEYSISVNKLQDVENLFEYIFYKYSNEYKNKDISLIGFINSNRYTDKKIQLLNIQHDIYNYKLPENSVLRSILDDYIKDDIEEFMETQIKLFYKNTEKE